MEKFLDKLEVIWEKYSLIICIVLGLVTASFYYFYLIDGIRNTVSNVITFSSIVIGVNGVFLTLLITLQESPAFARLKHVMPSFQSRLYISLRKLIHHGLIVVTISIIITLLPPSPGRIYSAIGVGIWFYFFWSMTIGSFYSVKLVTDIIVKNFDIPSRKMQK
ncbi:hypothetical protein [Virgibacillus ndiopensis]|uniref:hypothetical protein n=1 Tax=Virgibacillus ndiopensis TaxID=2004408 RepID=UPI000C08530F|nr:hypothetical protein [Virgibacillus ndiopensis]